MKTLIVNKGTCRDCNETITSKHRHDYVTCKCGQCALDGGTDYIRSKGPINLTTLYHDKSQFDEIRQVISRNNYGKNFDKPQRVVKLCNMSNEWLLAVIDYYKDYDVTPLSALKQAANIWVELCIWELEYRKDNNIYRKNNKYEK